MRQISATNVSKSTPSLFALARRRIAEGVKWWAEHQAWPATDEIRIERHRSTCG